MGAYLRGELAAPPPLDQHMCNFGKWMDGVGLERYGAFSNFTNIHQLHHQVHALGVELVTLQSQGCNAQAIAKFPELEILRDKLLEQLEQLSTNPSNVAN